MNRSHLSLDTFDPPPLALGERTTRLVEPVNPRAAFEAFERGEHFGPAHASTGFDVKAFQRAMEELQVHVRNAGAGYAALAASFEAVKYQPVWPATYNDMLDAAIRHKAKFGVEATRALLTRKFGTRRLADIQRRQYAEAIAALNGPEPDDGEGDTPDIAQ